MQEVQARIRLLTPFTIARTGRRFTFQRRLVTLCAWLMLFPNCGPLPQTSHTRGIKTPNFVLRMSGSGLLQEGIKPNGVLPLKYMGGARFGQVRPVPYQKPSLRRTRGT